MSKSVAFAHAVESIFARAEYRHARLGLAVHALGDGTRLFERDAQYYFAGASTTKIPTVASALSALGPHFRFRTVVRHTGRIDSSGTLLGDLVIVASGDPNLSARLRPDDSLAFTDVDHVLSGAPGADIVPGDPLVVLRTLAQTVARTGIRRITGRVCIDITLFPEGFRELGTLVVLSPIVVNDNVVDVTVVGASTPGEPVELVVRPATRYISFVSSALTGEPDTPATLTLSDEDCDTAGARIVRIRGSVPAGTTQLYVHPVRSPSGFARTLFVELLEAAGVVVETGTAGASDYRDGSQQFSPAIVAEHVSPPFAQAAKIVLKVSQNLHAELCPRIVGAYVAGVRGEDAEAAGFARLALFLTENGVDADGIVQGDACGRFGYYTPDFMCRLLRAIAAHSIGPVLRESLPILGRDGTLHDIATGFAAAGHVFAKTGTDGFTDRLAPRMVVQAKGLAGYIDCASGQKLVFAAYANTVPLAPDRTWSHTGTMLGEIAAAAYDLL